MATHNFKVSVDDQAFLEEGGEEFGAVRKVEQDHLVVYVEGAGDFKVDGPAVKAAHDGKVILAKEHLSAEMVKAIEQAHATETR